MTDCRNPADQLVPPVEAATSATEPQETTLPVLLTALEVAAVFRVHERTLSRWRVQGKLQSALTAGPVRYDVKDVQALLRGKLKKLAPKRLLASACVAPARSSNDVKMDPENNLDQCIEEDW